MSDRNTQLQLESTYRRREPLDFTPFDAALEALTAARIAELDEIVLNATLNELQALFAGGSLTSAEFATYCIWRIREYDEALQSVDELNPQALILAHQRDLERGQGQIMGSLHGIPILLKDNVNTADTMQTTAGAAIMIGFHAAEDAFLVMKLREAGAIILGKCNMSEWAFFMSSDAPSGYSFRGGQTRNPYGTFDAGGSSTGSGVALAAGFAPVTIGTETCGSLVSPACQNSLVTIKPSIALISRSGVIPIVDAMDTAGPFTRTVADAALMLNVLAGQDERDPDTAATAPLFGTDFTQFLDASDLAGLGVGLWRPQTEDALMGEDDHAALDRAGEALTRAGARVVDVRVEKTMPFETVFPVLTNGFRHCLNTYLAAQGGAAPVRSMADIVAFNDTSLDHYAPYNQALLVDSQNAPVSPEEYYTFAAEKRAAMREYIASVMMEYDVQVIASIGYNFSAYYATAGYPALAVPCGYHTTGEPVGITFSARYLEEPLLIRVGFAFEQATQWRRLPVLRGGAGTAQA
jgi:amidase